MSRAPAGGQMAVDDVGMMARALALAARARGRTAPNPMVGAVCVQGGRVVGEGWHVRAGTAHAEPQALAQAGAQAKGATLYVTLEPCHHHGRTGPCTEAILRAQVGRVVVGAPDNDERVCGRGLRYLRRHHVAVTTGVAEAACRQLNEAYHFAKAHQRPLVVAKWAQSLDGCVATASGQSKWLTGPQARQFGHRLRNALDGIAVGRGTVAADDPTLTCRDVPGGRDPARIVFDSHATTAPTARVVQAAATSAAATFLICSAAAPRARRDALSAAGATVLPVAADAQGRVLLQAGLEALARAGLHSVLLEGGPTLLGAAFDLGLVARAYCFVAPMVVGGALARRSILGRGCQALATAPRLAQMRLRQLGPDVLLSGRVEGS